MLLDELKHEAIRHGEKRILVSKAINPLMRHYRAYQSQLGKGEEPLYIQRDRPGEGRSYVAGGISLDSPATVEWYIENIRDISSYDFSRINIREWGTKNKVLTDYLVDTYYAPEPEIDIYEMPPGQDY